MKSSPSQPDVEITSRAEEELRPVLVTGFEPYGGRGSNPAYDAMRVLDGRKIGGADVIGRALPVAIGSIKSHIETLLEEISPSAIISLGLWPGEPMIRMERIGINIADFEIADNEAPSVVTSMFPQTDRLRAWSRLPLGKSNKRCWRRAFPFDCLRPPVRFFAMPVFTVPRRIERQSPLHSLRVYPSALHAGTSCRACWRIFATAKA